MYSCRCRYKSPYNCHNSKVYLRHWLLDRFRLHRFSLPVFLCFFKPSRCSSTPTLLLFPYNSLQNSNSPERCGWFLTYRFNECLPRGFRKSFQCSTFKQRLFLLLLFLLLLIYWWRKMTLHLIKCIEYESSTFGGNTIDYKLKAAPLLLCDGL